MENPKESTWPNDLTISNSANLLSFWRSVSCSCLGISTYFDIVWLHPLSTLSLYPCTHSGSPERSHLLLCSRVTQRTTFKGRRLSICFLRGSEAEVWGIAFKGTWMVVIILNTWPKEIWFGDPATSNHDWATKNFLCHPSTMHRSQAMTVQVWTKVLNFIMFNTWCSGPDHVN